MREPERLGQAVHDALKATIGPCDMVLFLRARGEEPRRTALGSIEIDDPASPRSRAIAAIAHKVMDTGHAALDVPQYGEALTVPVVAQDATIGALHVRPARSGAAGSRALLDLVQLIARHVGQAYQNLLYAEDFGILEDLGTTAIPIGAMSLRAAKQAFEQRVIRARLKASQGNIAAAARSLDMDRGQLSRLLKKHGVDKSRFREQGG